MMGSGVKKSFLVLLLCCCLSRDCYGISGCSDICSESNIGPRCVCAENFGLEAKDNNTCKELIFYNEGADILMKTRNEAGIESTSLLYSVIQRKAIITGLSFDARTNTLFVSDAGGPAIFALYADSWQDERRYLVQENITFPSDVAFDWTSGNLYWIDSGRGTAEVVSVGTTLRRKVLVERTERGVFIPVSIALSPCEGVMFIATVGLAYYHTSVSMYGMDGKNRRILYSVQGVGVQGVFPVSLAVHPSRSFLFWSDPHEGTISYVSYYFSRKGNIEGDGLSMILKRGMDGVMDIAVTGTDVLYTLDEPAASGRVNRVKLPEHDKGVGWKSIAYGLAFSGKSDCLIKNGGCDYLCLSSESGSTCACPSEMTLDEDGKSCKEDDNSFALFGKSTAELMQKTND